MLDMLWTKSEADEASSEAAEDWLRREEAKDCGWFDGSGIGKDFLQDAMCGDLKTLGEARG